MWPFSSSYRFLPLDKVATPLNGSSQTNARAIAEYDYVIIGGGTAGCILASRLSEDPSVSVLLLERGGLPSWMSKVPLLAFANIFRENPKVDYIYNWYASIAPVDGVVETHADVNLNPPSPGGATSRPFCTIWSPGKIALLAGKVLGGTSNLNAQIYSRPYPGELDTWGEGWEYARVERLLKKSEKSLSLGQSSHRGTEGPWLTKKMDKTLFGSDTQARKAANAMRIPTILESNLPEGPAIGVFEFERTSHPRGYKLPTFEAFLPPNIIRERKNLTICTKVVVTSIDIGGQAGDKLQAKGVFLVSDQNQKNRYYVAAKREVILCAGAIVSPQILMLSGVGPKRHLEEVGIPVLKDLPGVGEHLQDHAPISTTFAVPLQDSISILQKKPLIFILEFFKFLLFGVGYLVFPVPQSVIYLRSALLTDEGELLKESDILSSELDTRSPDNIPDIKVNIDPCKTTFRPLPDRRNKGYFSLFTGGLLPKSLGHVRLLSKDPFDKADCMLGFNAHEEDRRVMRKAIRFCVKLAQKMKEQGYDIEPLLVPKSNDDKDLDDFILEEPRTGYHYSSTCRMAPEHPQNSSDSNDTPGVVDPQLRVYGIHQLRVADASIFPTIPAGHPQVHTVLVAEKCAEMIKDSWK